MFLILSFVEYPINSNDLNGGSDFLQKCTTLTSAAGLFQRISYTESSWNFPWDVKSYTCVSRRDEAAAQNSTQVVKAQDWCCWFTSKTPPSDKVKVTFRLATHRESTSFLPKSDQLMETVSFNNELPKASRLHTPLSHIFCIEFCVEQLFAELLLKPILFLYLLFDFRFNL